jgi:hypothetical protein
MAWRQKMKSVTIEVALRKLSLVKCKTYSEPYKRQEHSRVKISTFVGSCQSEIPIEGQAETNDDRADIEAYLERLLLIVGKTRHSLDAHIDNTEQGH